MSACIPASRFFCRGAVLPNGYWSWKRRKTIYGHRHVFEECYGSIPKGHEIHHSCGRRDCVNPEHMMLVTRQQHSQLHRATHCRRGHPLSDANLIRDPYPRCRACRTERQREHRSTDEYRARRREQRRGHGASLVGDQLRKALT